MNCGLVENLDLMRRLSCSLSYSDFGPKKPRKMRNPCWSSCCLWCLHAVPCWGAHQRICGAPVESWIRNASKIPAGMAGCRAYRTERVILGAEENLVGCIDFCAKDEAGALALIDRKRSSGLETKYCSSCSLLLPLAHLPDWRRRNHVLKSSTCLNRVEQRTSNVQNRFQLWSDYMLWSGAAAVTACKARLGDQIFT